MDRQPHHRALLAAVLAGILWGCTVGTGVLAPARLTLPSGGAVVELRFAATLPLVEVMLDGSGPYTFIVDTNSAVTLVSRRAADAAGLEESGLMVSLRGGGGGQRLRYPARFVASLQVGAAEFEELQAVVQDPPGPLARISEAAGVPVDGLLGFNTFRECLLTLDCPGRALVLAFGALEADDPDTLDLDPVSPTPSVPVVLSDASGGRMTLQCVLDTGSDAAILLPAGLRELPFPSRPVGRSRSAMIHGTGVVRRERLAAVAVIGRQWISRPFVGFYESGAYLSREQGGIGMGILCAFRITFDQRNGLVRILLPAEPEVHP